MNAYTLLADIEARAEAAGFSVADLCRESGIAHSMVSRWRKKIYEPKLSNLERLDAALAALQAPAQRAAGETLADLL
jgi:transcriptional regulator with XRE-family HTH domain